MPRMPSGSVTRRFPLSRAAQVYQLLCQGVRLYAPAVHTVPRGLCALQDPPAPRQDQVLQVHLGALRIWERMSRVREAAPEVPRRGRTSGMPTGWVAQTLCWESRQGEWEGQSCLALEISHTGRSPGPRTPGLPTQGTGDSLH